MNILKKLLKAIFNLIIVFFVFIIIILLCNYFQISIMNKKYSNFMGYSIFEVSTGSMSGAIEVHDVILIKITQDVSENDIITYFVNDEIITHRVIKITEKGIITKGDANTGEDKIINKQDVIGKVIKVLPNFGIWINVFTDIKVIIPIIITICLFGLALSSNKNTDTDKKETFSRFMRNRRKKKDGKSKEKKKN